MDERGREELGRGVTTLAVGLADLEPAVGELRNVLDDLLGSFSSLGPA